MKKGGPKAALSFADRRVGFGDVRPQSRGGVHVRASSRAKIGERISVRMYSPLVFGTLGSSYSTSHAMAARAPASVVGGVSSSSALAASNRGCHIN
jgi:hypothetical protein